MENSESESSSWLEILPIEVNTVIASYLNARDVGQCCATSSTMRQMFSDNSIWRPRCQKSLSEYLKITPGKVIPIFVNPQMENSSLSPLPEWRISYMRENHLWKNWRKGKYIEEQINKFRSPSEDFHFFYNNDCVIAVYEDRIELLDVAKLPGLGLKVVENVYFGTKKPFDLKIKIVNDMIVFLLWSGVQVFGVDLNRKKCPLKHTFLFENSLVSTNSPSRETSIFNVPTRLFGGKQLIVGNIFVGILERESTMHIWNLETGQKLKEEACLLQVLEIQGTSDTMHVVLTLVKAEPETKTLLAYSLETLTFLSFNKTLNMNSTYSVYKDFVVIRFDNMFQVFNYQTSTMLATMPTDSDPQFVKNNLLFTKDRDIKVFNLIKKTKESMSLNCVSCFWVLSDRFVQLFLNSWGNGMLWEFDESYQHIVPTDMKFNFTTSEVFLNKACTRYIVREFHGYKESVGYTLNFW